MENTAGDRLMDRVLSVRNSGPHGWPIIEAFATARAFLDTKAEGGQALQAQMASHRHEGMGLVLKVEGRRIRCLERPEAGLRIQEERGGHRDHARVPKNRSKALKRADIKDRQRCESLVGRLGIIDVHRWLTFG